MELAAPLRWGAVLFLEIKRSSGKPVATDLDARSRVSGETEWRQNGAPFRELKPNQFSPGGSNTAGKGGPRFVLYIELGAQERHTHL